MKLVCAWCGITIDRSEYTHNLERSTSHGMCPGCYEALAAKESGTSLQQFLDTLPVPVIVIDDKNAVMTMNVRACELLGRKPGEAEAPLCAEVFDCMHSSAPDGCGRTIHCVGCAIRRSVTTTFNSGVPQFRVPATRSVISVDDISEAVLTVDTVKIGNLVALRCIPTSLA